MDSNNILNHINIHFNKLFTSCKDATIFIPPSFVTTSDIDSLIVLSYIIDIICNSKTNPTISNIIKHSTLVQIINIKCNEFIQIHPWNNNLDNFIITFDNYIHSMTEHMINSTNNNINTNTNTNNNTNNNTNTTDYLN